MHAKANVGTQKPETHLELHLSEDPGLTVFYWVRWRGGVGPSGKVVVNPGGRDLHMDLHGPGSIHGDNASMELGPLTGPGAQENQK